MNANLYIKRIDGKENLNETYEGYRLGQRQRMEGEMKVLGIRMKRVKRRSRRERAMEKDERE